uniref:NADH dehydrogenase [ubiquinone] 1 beta subcomplex subunit 1 n=1 Tax=Sarcophilus harrisii TaxID=9305 RepID=A0A7N4PJS2_SARHA
ASSQAPLCVVHSLVPMGFVVGYYPDKKSDEKLTPFLNNNMRGELKPNEETTWKYTNFS